METNLKEVVLKELEFDTDYVTNQDGYTYRVLWADKEDLEEIAKRIEKAVKTYLESK
jgi:hypothetical protein